MGLASLPSVNIDLQSSPWIRQCRLNFVGHCAVGNLLESLITKRWKHYYDEHYAILADSASSGVWIVPFLTETLSIGQHCCVIFKERGNTVKLDMLSMRKQ
ncbi:hypothetical protein J3459_013544 [Metarhizium acridum]|uniref:uncharacterized protein n=1 Tax=Metarhizium acridum TaxID=92637 RepID=UPI001C6BBE38|nr:hypothetical protein J3459_013544 [Metarhizium acridum]KAG8421769.1 hypothetical protein J3458_003615 [Metarhizium acridum]